MIKHPSPVTNLNKLFIPLRPIPYPYRAMIAICSDLDETPNLDTYLETAGFLNTTGNTKMGEGVGLEVGNSIYFDMAPDQFSYWNTDDRGRDIIRTLIRSGHIDCLHSYGDRAVSRDHASRALEELTKHNCFLRVWVDHGKAPTNFGRDIMLGRGDIPGDPAYHADLTIQYGIKYAWLGRVTNVVGQEAPRKLSGIWTPEHPIASFKSLSKEFAKGHLARFGYSKYTMHLSNKLIKRTILRDGQEVREFIRSTFHWGGISYDDTAQGLAEVLTKKNLDLLVKRQGVAIIYTHLGKNGNHIKFPSRTIDAFTLLKRYQEEGKILVTTTFRLLNYIDTIQKLKWECTLKNNVIIINITIQKNVDLLQGITFCIPKSQNVIINVNGKQVRSVKLNPKDHSGRYSISIPWNKLEFPIS